MYGVYECLSDITAYLHRDFIFKRDALVKKKSEASIKTANSYNFVVMPLTGDTGNIILSLIRQSYQYSVDI